MRARIRIPAQARRGDALEIRTLLDHPNESGWRLDAEGRAYPRRIVRRFVCTYGGEEVVRVEMERGIARNPYLTFWLRAEHSGEVVFRWEDEGGAVLEMKERLTVV